MTKEPEDVEKEDVIKYIREEYPATRSAEDQAEIVIRLLELGVAPEDLRTTFSDIQELYPDATRTHVKNLVEKVGLLKVVEQTGGSYYFLHGRVDHIGSFGEANRSEVRRDIQMLVEDCKSNSEVCDVAAERLGTPATAEEVKSELLNEGLFEAVKKYDRAYKALERSSVDLSQRQYDQMGWRPRAKRYTFTTNLKEVAS